LKSSDAAIIGNPFGADAETHESLGNPEVCRQFDKSRWFRYEPFGAAAREPRGNRCT
jgi:hypothetical protein